ncbi:hypothetical protein E3N88_45065 [Mikania micrantha]|uniref:Integrase catalytic domain-containing protein n=1 Tax=Mikania micrantha TaxID=192012 RepID=A0A5N6LAH1_9ASTR|nr:hypothetical protein E3N88_45065 [Mikania micrantha]
MLLSYIIDLFLVVVVSSDQTSVINLAIEVFERYLGVALLPWYGVPLQLVVNFVPGRSFIVSALRLSTQELVQGVPKITHPSQVCDCCLAGKQIRLPFPKETQFRAEHPLDLVYAEVCGPIQPETKGGNRYLLLIVDDNSRYMWPFLIRTKAEVFERFKEFKESTELEYGKKIKGLRTDNGGEFNSQAFKTLCAESGMHHQLTAPYSPQQNGVVERRNQTIMSMTRCLLKPMNLPQDLWGEAVRHALYILNRSPTKSMKTTPYEGIKGRKPRLEHLRVFGCVGYAKVLGGNLRKLDDRSKKLVHLGCQPNTKAYRMFDPDSKRIHVTYDVKFDESKSWNWERNEEPQRPEWTEFLVHSESRRDEPEGQQVGYEQEIPDGMNLEEDNGETSEVESGWSSSVKSRGPMLRRLPDDQDGSHDPTKAPDERYDHTPLRGSEDIDVIYGKAQGSQLLLLEGEPVNYKDAQGIKEWEEAMEAEISSIEKNNTWQLTERPVGVSPIGLKWVYKVKRDASGEITKHKARLVAKGYVQQHGVDYGEVFAPVARIETVRLILAVAAQNGWWVHHMDVKSAFLHGDLKELVYVTQPEGFVKKGAEQKVYKLSKDLYGLKQAPRAWNTKLDGVLKELGFIKCKHEPAVCRKGAKDETLVIAVYVDDLLITGGCSDKIRELQKKMEEKFEMTDLGLSDCNSTKFSMEPGLKLSKNEESEEADATQFRKWIGCLRYLIHTRPDLSYSVGYVSRFMQNPKQVHVQALKQILRYVKGTTKVGLFYHRGGSNILHGYSDSSYSADKDDGKSTTGMVFFYGTRPIAWNSQKQATVTLSSCEAEFMAASTAACQAIWLRGLLAEITGREEAQVEIKVDNKSAIALIRNPVFQGRSKHIDTRYHFIRESVEKEQIRIEYVSGDEQKADILTKALPRIKFEEMKIKLGLKDLEG